MAPRTTRQTPEQRLDKLLRDHPNGKLLRAWLAQADNVTLACWDEGHNWDQYDSRSTYTPHNDGVWDTRQPCLRTVDGVSCHVRRVRHIDTYNGRIAKANGYDYSGAPAHRLPQNPDTGYTILDKNVRAAIRLARFVRSSQGEET